MKNINLYAIGLALLLFSACNMLDIDESVGAQKSTIFKYVDQCKKALNYSYTFLPSDFKGVDGTSRSCATDDAINVWTTSDVRIFNDGSWSPIVTVDAQWSNYFTAIRSTNTFLENFTMDAMAQFDNYLDYEDQKRVFVNYLYEARFLRAFYHFELAKRYGDIPWVTKTLTSAEANSIVRSPFQSVIDSIVQECDTVMKYLPVSYNNMPGSVIETGRVTKGAAMALKSRALLYAASKLHNPSNDLSKWRRAAEASYALIDSASTKGWYTLPTAFFEFGKWNSTELILETREENSNYFEIANTPIGFAGGNTGICPSQNLVDAFERLNSVGGGEFNWNDPNHAASPYANRDNRLGYTVLRDGSLFKQIEVQTWIGGKDAQPRNGATLTGYYIKKFLRPEPNLDPSVGTVTKALHCWPLFRYSEILLNYAEAVTEAFPNNNSAYTDATFSRSADWAINLLRTRAGISSVAALDHDAFQKKVRNERRVELAFEDHRFWDIRRWKIADQCTTIYGTKIEKNDTGVKTYTPNQVVATRVWYDKMYLFPIPLADTFNNPNLGQNPGW